MTEILRRKNSASISHQVSPALILDVPDGTCQRAPVDDSRMIRNGRSARVTLCEHLARREDKKYTVKS
jgi:hypothetical protein